ncbi:MAG: histidine phosphatase family protein [Pelovirga sp.]
MSHSPGFRHSLSTILTLACLLAWSPALHADDAEDALWRALRSGEAVALIRHALAPGTGDPSGFQLEDCATQRNLSEEGRRQARQIGTAFRENGITSAQVWSSRWCRCLETARLLELGPVEPTPSLDSFFNQPGRGPAQTATLRELLSRRHEGPPRVLVTHQVNITGLTGIVPGSGDMVVVRPTADGDLRVMGRLAPGR